MKFYKRHGTPPWFVVVTGGGCGCEGGGTDGGGAGGKICRLQTQDNNILSYILADFLLIRNLFGFLGNTRDYDVR